MTRLAAELVESAQQGERRRGLAWARSAQAVTMYSYLLGAFFVTSRLWENPAVLRQTGDSSDVDQATWFVRYAATALTHFRLPALTTATMNAPHNVNLMWNTSFLLPGILVSPVTLLAGPQTALTTLLVIGFAGSAASMFCVLRRWQASTLAAALGGALYGFSPALIDSGIGHYAFVLAMLPPLLVDRVLRLVTGRGSALRNGLWLGVLSAAQLFISEELLVDTVIATVLLLAVLAACRPRQVLSRARPALAGFAAAAVIGLVLSARGLWVQFHGVHVGDAAATTIISYHGHLTNLGTLPYAFVNPAPGVLLHTTATGRIASDYPQPMPEYLAYLGIPLILVLLLAIIRFWRHLPIRVAGLTCILLEWLGLGGRPLVPGTVTLPAFLLPWRLVQHVPVIEGLVPDRLCILADGMAAVVLALSLDLVRGGAVAPFSSLRNGAMAATAVAALALVPVIPSPYGTVPASQPPANWAPAFAALHLPDDARVLLVPFPYTGTSQVLRWQADTGDPATMIGGMFLAPGQPGRQSRAGRSAMTPTTYYFDYLWTGNPSAAVQKPSAAQLQADISSMNPDAVVAADGPQSPAGKYLISVFGKPTVQVGGVLGWRLHLGNAVAAASAAG